jgi:Putative Flp pilus-assembly TadE/G-like
MLVQLALIVFGLFGILAAIVDMGFVRLTQVQMQNAADTAAVEGLSRRDAVSMVDPMTGQPQIDGFASDCMRRLAAHDFVRWTFDDDLNPDNGDPRSFGAGPNIKFTDGTGDLSAYQFMSVPAEDEGGPAYKPFLQLNQSTNDVSGDMVSGAFDGFAAPANSMPGLYEPDSTYARTDYLVGMSVGSGSSDVTECPKDIKSTDPWPGTVSSGSTVSDPSFLVRLRRTNGLNEGDQIAGVSSSGSSLPLLFGRGTLIQDNPDSEYQPRRDGITVRATAIADARPALRVGASLPSLRGAAPLLLTQAFFDALMMPTSVMVDTSSGLVSDGSDGRFVGDVQLMNTVGLPVPSPAFPPSFCVGGTTTRVFAGIYSTADVVVGFGDLTLQWSSDCSSMTLTRTTIPIIASGNATTVLDTGLPNPTFNLQSTWDFAYVLDATGNPVPKSGVVFAPALVR